MADLHLGRRLGELDLLEDQRAALEGIVDIAWRVRPQGGGKAVIYRHIPHQGGPGKGPLQQIVAEQGVVRHPPLQRLLEGGDVIQSLATVYAPAAQVLEQIGYLGGVAVHASLAPQQPGQPAAAAQLHPGRQQGIALPPAPRLSGLVQGM